MNSTEWQKSSFSEANNNCVEVRAREEVVELRESDDADVIVRTTRLRFAAFLQGAKVGEFDHLVTNP
ncbi:hypothetical protein GCM10018790_29100 [Kitasatospora xanthocidica]|uniref:DUF397 domain-containing protein n=1 Tax=Kitasatospora xanthocidica TaxID=83382 RepID=UPI00167A326E|nr:DUF397 domain-containing protein [Kitasatospora xanthocidica]GHF49429.1 hypothetical protein GCM10018790_29100 [Kitasatospora xanthocidica]